MHSKRVHLELRGISADFKQNNNSKKRGIVLQQGGLS